jgi:hypothetical protein
VIVSGRLRSSPKMVSSARKLFRPEHIEEITSRSREELAADSRRPCGKRFRVVTFATARGWFGSFQGTELCRAIRQLAGLQHRAPKVVLKAARDPDRSFAARLPLRAVDTKTSF